MQEISVGIDLIEINRIAKTLERFGDRFLNRIYTESEIRFQSFTQCYMNF